jgi:hypothetical protein
MAAGRLPSAFFYDTVHRNSMGNSLIARRIFYSSLMQGWLS